MTTIMNLGPPPDLATYEELATEYYLPELHPTCYNLREASALLLGAWLPSRAPAGGIVEVGAGSSLLAELLRRRGRSLAGLLITDSAPAMLAHSAVHVSAGARLMVADAAQLPIRATTVGALVGVLADPYNHEAFWTETARVLRPSGTVAVTVPAWEWSTLYRATEREHNQVAAFVDQRGSALRLPSIVLPFSAQRDLIERAGLRVIRHDVVRLSRIRGPWSRKLAAVGSPDLPVLRGVVATPV